MWKFESSNDWVKVAIPFTIWEVIRQYAAVDLSLVDKTDAEIRKLVKSAIQQRIKRYAETEELDKSFENLTGLLAFGDVQASREEQITHGCNYFIELRARQWKIKSDIAELQRMQRKSEDQ